MKFLVIIACITWSAYSQMALQPMLAHVTQVLPRMFAGLDGNHDGSMSHNEFNAFLISADTNGDGCMSLSEYVSISSIGQATATQVFNHLGTANNNCHTATSLNGVYMAMDSNGDGGVSEQELGAWFAQVVQWSLSIPDTLGVSQGVRSGPSVHVTLPGGGQLGPLVHTTFTNFDRNGDGTFHHSEFNAFITASDTDSDGCMSRDEYAVSSGTNRATALEVFKRFDMTSSNCLKPSNLNQAFASMDLNGDGGVTESEFDTWFTGVLTNIFG